MHSAMRIKQLKREIVKQCLPKWISRMASECQSVSITEGFIVTVSSTDGTTISIKFVYVCTKILVDILMLRTESMVRCCR